MQSKHTERICFRLKACYLLNRHRTFCSAWGEGGRAIAIAQAPLLSVAPFAHLQPALLPGKNTHAVAADAPWKAGIPLGKKPRGSAAARGSGCGRKREREKTAGAVGGGLGAHEGLGARQQFPRASEWPDPRESGCLPQQFAQRRSGWRRDGQAPSVKLFQAP